MMLNIAPTTLEQYRLYYTGAYGGKITASDLTDYLHRSKFVPRRIMAVGSAFDALVEHGPDNYYTSGSYTVPVSYWKDPITISEKAVKMIRKYRKFLDGQVFEVPGETFFNVKGYRVRMGFKVDAIHGMDIRERKTHHSTFAPDYFKYLDSLQWRVYLHALPDAHRIVYDVFNMATRDECGNHDCKYHKFVYHRYAGMQADIEKYLYGLITFCEDRDLLDFITTKTK